VHFVGVNCKNENNKKKLKQDVKKALKDIFFIEERYVKLTSVD
jgi:hypothetical protein